MTGRPVRLVGLGEPGSLVGEPATAGPSPTYDDKAAMTPEASAPVPRERLLRRPSWPEAQRVADALRTETIGGALLLGAAVLAIVWANSPWRDAYATVRDTTIGPASLHLSLTLGQWAADGLLALFFLVAGLELKRELLVGDLRSPARAAVPVVAALGGVVVPAGLYAVTVLALGGDPAALRGWAVPTATDIAFALAVLAVLGSHLPAALRSFLLTLAVVDDLVAITIIAVFYTTELDPVPLLAALAPLAGFAWLVQHRITRCWLLLPLGGLTWALVHASGVHATVAGVLLALVVPVRPRGSVPSLSSHPGGTDIAHRFEHRLRPLSAGLAVPVFAFFASGVTIVGGGVGAAAADTAAVAVVVGLVAGKAVGVFGSTYAVARLTRAELAEGLTWSDVAGLSLLTGIGFTVSLLVGELAFGVTSDRDAHVRLAVLAGSLVSAVLASVVLRARNRAYERIWQEEQRDSDADGIPDVFA